MTTYVHMYYQDSKGTIVSLHVIPEMKKLISVADMMIVVCV